MTSGVYIVWQRIKLERVPFICLSLSYGDRHPSHVFVYSLSKKTRPRFQPPSPAGGAAPPRVDCSQKGCNKTFKNTKCMSEHLKAHSALGKKVYTSVPQFELAVARVAKL